MTDISLEYSLYCDETWTSPNIQVNSPCYVFYGLLLTPEVESQLINHLKEYKESRGLLIEGKYAEIKWVDADNEAKSSAKSGLKNRNEQYLDIFFDYLRKGTLSFGYLFINKSDFQRIEPQFIQSHNASKHDFFFMLYFQFLYHCFIKNQTKYIKTSIFIDDRNMGAEGVRYDIELLRACLNKRLFLDAAPRMQIPLSHELRRQFEESINLVSLESSKNHELIQLSDLSAGCVRHAIEHKMEPPCQMGQLSLFQNGNNNASEVIGAKSSLSKYFYQSLRQIDKYRDIQLNKPSFHHRFSIFPFQFI